MQNTQKKSLKVSVLVSAFNVEKYIQISIESILQQTHKNFEILVVDDGSTDKTFNIIQAFNDPRIHSYSQKNKGKSATLNDLIELSTGQYLVIHDADDFSHPERIETLLNAFHSNASLGLVMSSYCLLLDDKHIAPKPKALNTHDCKALIDNFQMPAHDPTLIVERELAQELKFDPDLKLAEGYDFILRAGEITQMTVLKDILYSYRIQTESITHTHNNDKPLYVLTALNKARARRRMKLLNENDFFASNQCKFASNSSDFFLANHFKESVFLLIQENRRFEAIQVAFYSFKKCYQSILYLKPLMYLFFTKSGANKIRHIFKK